MPKNIKITIEDEKEVKDSVDLGTASSLSTHKTKGESVSDSDVLHKTPNSSTLSNNANPSKTKQSDMNSGTSSKRNVDEVNAESDQITKIDTSDVDKIRIQHEHKFKK